MNNEHVDAFEQFFCYSLKLECEKLAQEKTEMQRHYVMVRTNIGECNGH